MSETFPYDRRRPRVDQVASFIFSFTEYETWWEVILCSHTKSDKCVAIEIREKRKKEEEKSSTEKYIWSYNNLCDDLDVNRKKNYTDSDAMTTDTTQPRRCLVSLELE